MEVLLLTLSSFIVGFVVGSLFRDAEVWPKSREPVSRRAKRKVKRLKMEAQEKLSPVDMEFKTNAEVQVQDLPKGPFAKLKRRQIEPIVEEWE